MEESNLIKSILWRFVRAFIAGAVSTMVILMPFSANSWTEMQTWLMALALAGSVGGISGLIQGIDKYFRYKN